VSAGTAQATPVSPARLAGLAVVFVWFALGGLGHFIATDAAALLVPPGLPAPRTLVLVSGAAEWLGAAGLLLPATRRAAGWGLCLLTVAVTPVHVSMLQHAEQWDIPLWALVLRLPLQGALLWLIWWSTATRRLPCPPPQRPDSGVTGRPSQRVQE
jgi:uncharacterized membrane protein